MVLEINRINPYLLSLYVTVTSIYTEKGLPQNSCHDKQGL